MKKILTFCVALTAAISLSAESYFLKNNWNGGDESWIELTEDDGAFIGVGVFGGNDFAINSTASDEGARVIKVENANASINMEDAELAVGDKVFFVYNPDEYASMDPKASGLFSMIIEKAGYAIKNGTWKNLIDDDPDDHDWWVLPGAEFAGEDVAIMNGSNLRTIKIENINASINTDKAELSKGDSVLFVFRPSLVNRYDEKESGLYAHITNKNGFAIHGTWGEKEASWKILAKYDDESFFVENVLFDGQNVQVITGTEIYDIKPENIIALLSDYTDAELEAGDIVLFSFTPDARSAYDETQSGLMALIIEKHGYALQSFFGEKELSWKAFVQDDEDPDFFLLKNSIFDGSDLYINNFAGSLGSRKIEAKNVIGSINYEDAELAAGDSVDFLFRPSLVNAYDEKQSGLYAMINKKNGYALRGTWGSDDVLWKNMILDDSQDDETYVLNEVIFDGKDVQIAGEEGVRTIKVQNIIALMLEGYTEAVLEEGDLVLFVYTPDTYSHYDETQSGLMALIISKKSATGVQNISNDVKATKVLMNGQLFIIKNGNMFNAAGVVVK